MLDGKDHFAIERCAMEIAVVVKVFFGANGGGSGARGHFQDSMGRIG